ncbi:RNA polymerase sigma factor [Microbacterium jejuense]|uniref:RNA polymerase sigma factor n=1 Tax=Microbacterium jejuense TaxID=1263637 RepID=UPI0031EE0CF0
MSTVRDPGSTVAAVYRLEGARIIAGLTRTTHDVGLAEDSLQDAMVAAIEKWPAAGIPANPAAWLTLEAKHRAIDRIRRAVSLDEKLGAVAHDERQRARVDVDVGGHDFDLVIEHEGIADDVLRLLFALCHPSLPRESRVALTLRLVGGLTPREIAHAYLVPERTVAQRILRGRRRLAADGFDAAVPAAAERQERLGGVLEVVYLIFTEGHAATVGDDWVRPELCLEALRLARMLTELAPADAEVHGLAALLELQTSRLPARVDAGGAPVRLADQDRGRWDQLLIARGFRALLRSRELSVVPGPYAIQAAIAAAHAHARTAPDTDWASIAELYGLLAHVAPSPVVTLNRAVAVARADGPEAGLRVLDELADAPELSEHHLLAAVRADLLGELGDAWAAAVELRRAAALAPTPRERELLTGRADALAPGGAPADTLGG